MDPVRDRHTDGGVGRDTVVHLLLHQGRRHRRSALVYGAGPDLRRGYLRGERLFQDEARRIGVPHQTIRKRPTEQP